MATYASRPAWEVKVRAASRARLAVPAGLGLLVLLSVLLRTNQLGIGFWIDEGLSVGIADRPAIDIPGILRQDGSPPLYYTLLHFWIRVFGTSEGAARSLSLVFAALSIPAAWWAARSLFGARAAWIAAVLATSNAFITHYAQEARMYALVVLLGLVVCGAFGRTFLGGLTGREQRRWAVGLAAGLAAMLYTHNWALFFATACGLAWLAMLARMPRGESRRELLIAGLLAFGGALLVYLPWVPTTLYQAAHTGAPWSNVPGLDDLLKVPGRLLGDAALAVLALVGGAGVAGLLTRRDARARAALLMLGIGLGTIVIAWLASQVSPAWANRYLAVGLPPLLLAAAGGLAHAGRLGIVAVALVAAVGIADGAPAEKSNVRTVAEDVTPGLRPGDLLLSTQPEQIPVLHYYMPPGLEYATLTGPVTELGVTDWRDGTDKLEASTPERDLKPLLDALPAGQRLVFVSPSFRSLSRWRAPWTKAIRLRSLEWQQYLS